MRVTTRSMAPSSIVRGAPGRGSSYRPSSRSWTKRPRHLLTVCSRRPACARPACRPSSRYTGARCARPAPGGNVCARDAPATSTASLLIRQNQGCLRSPRAHARPPCRSNERRQHERPTGWRSPVRGPRHRDIIGHTRTLAASGTPGAPTPQRTLAASGRADRARPAVSRMLGAHTATVKRQWTARDQQERRPAAQARRCPPRPSKRRSGRDAARHGRGGAGIQPGAGAARRPHARLRGRRLSGGREGLHFLTTSRLGTRRAAPAARCSRASWFGGATGMMPPIRPGSGSCARTVRRLCGFTMDQGHT